MIVKTNPLNIHAGIWGLIVNLAIFVASSLMVKPSDTETAEEFIKA